MATASSHARTALRHWPRTRMRAMGTHIYCTPTDKRHGSIATSPVPKPSARANRGWGPSAGTRRVRPGASLRIPTGGNCGWRGLIQPLFLILCDHLTKYVIQAINVLNSSMFHSIVGASCSAIHIAPLTQSNLIIGILPAQPQPLPYPQQAC